VRLFEPADQRTRPWQRHVEIVDPEEQKAVAGFGVAGTCQRGMLVGTPSVQAEPDRSILIDDLSAVVVGRIAIRRLGHQDGRVTPSAFAR
jgi:hypothetical protein